MNLPLIKEMNTCHLFRLFLCPETSAVSPQRGGRGEREWQGPLLKRVDYLMKGNQLERYGGL